MNDIPCSHLLDDGPHCYLGWNTLFECLGCCAYDVHPEPSVMHWITWHESRNGTGTRPDADNNQAGTRSEGE